jgi:cobalt/nickel transport system permease protein
MTLAFAQTPQTNSFLSRLDPRWKLAACVVAIASIAVLRSVSATVLALCGSLLLALLARLPGRWFLQRIGSVGVLLLLFTIPLPFLLSAEDRGWHVGLLRISQPGIELALTIGAKTLALVTLLMVLQATAPLEVNLQAAHSLHLPGVLVQLGLLSYRYVFVLADELRRLRIAMRVRGFRRRMSRHTYQTAGHLAGTLLVRGYERAERVGQAMRCRGFDGRFRSLTNLATSPKDVMMFLIVTLSATGLAAWDWLAQFAG